MALLTDKETKKLTLLKDDLDKTKVVKDNLDSVLNILKEYDAIIAEEFSDWTKTKLIDGHKDIMYDTLYNEIQMMRKQNKEEIEIKKIEKKRKSYSPTNYPSHLKIGEIIYARFGFGYCSELSFKHFVVILSTRVGSNYLVAPLTSTKPKGKIIHYNDLNLTDIKDSYVLLNQIRFISYRRLKNINAIPNGRKHINVQEGQDRVKEILDAFNQIIR